MDRRFWKWMLIKLSWGRGWGGEGKEPLSASLLLSPLHPPSHRTSEHSEQPRDLRGGGSALWQGQRSEVQLSHPTAPSCPCPASDLRSRECKGVGRRGQRDGSEGRKWLSKKMQGSAAPKWTGGQARAKGRMPELWVGVCERENESQGYRWVRVSVPECLTGKRENQRPTSPAGTFLVQTPILQIAKLRLSSGKPGAGGGGNGPEVTRQVRP